MFTHSEDTVSGTASLQSLKREARLPGTLSFNAFYGLSSGNAHALSQDGDLYSGFRPLG